MMFRERKRDAAARTIAPAATKMSIQSMDTSIVKRRSGFAAFFLLLFLNLSAQAQVMLKSNDPAIRYDLIKPSHTFSKVTTFDSAGKKTIEFVNDKVTEVDPATHAITFYRFRQAPVGRFIKDVSVIGPTPVSMQFFDITNKREQSINFRPSVVEVESTTNGVRSNKAYNIAEGYFDDNIILDIVGFFPLRKGVQVRLNTFNSSAPSKIDNMFDIEYVFDDRLAGDKDSAEECRVLHFINGEKAGYIWIDKVSNEVVKEVATSAGNTSLLLVRI